MADEKLVAIQIEESVATVIFNHPPANILSTAVMVELNSAVDQIAADPHVKAVVLAAAGAFFIAGADIKEIASLKGAADGEKASRLGQGLFDKIAGLPVPVIAAINGLCLGGGTELALACHLRIAGERARIGLPEISLGIMPGFGGTQRLPRLVGTARALEICLTGDTVTASAALAMGLVNKVVPDAEVLKQAVGLAKRIALKSRVSITAIMKAVQEGSTRPLAEGLALESKLFAAICDGHDMREGLAAFVEKRQPKFQDR